MTLLVSALANINPTAMNNLLKKTYLIAIFFIGTGILFILIYSNRTTIPVQHFWNEAVSKFHQLDDFIDAKIDNNQSIKECNNQSVKEKAPITEANYESVSVPINLTYVHYEEKKICPEVPPIYQGPIKLKLEDIIFQEIEKLYPQLEPGGIYRPKECKARQSLALIIPHRNRTRQLQIFINNMHDFLMKQQLHYQIFVVEQEEGKKFNRGKLLNVGFAEAIKRHQFDCVALHDSDLIPEDGRNLYRCSDTPRHLTAAIKRDNYELLYDAYFGGGTLFKTEQYELINGMSNEYWGWGGEDDDLYSRVGWSGLKITRYSPEISKYTNIAHKKAEPNPNRWAVLNKAKKRHRTDGLNNLNYRRKDIQFKRLFTWILVDI